MIPVRVQINSMKRNKAGQRIRKENGGQGIFILDKAGSGKVSEEVTIDQRCE